jgi:hypothetical protein
MPNSSRKKPMTTLTVIESVEVKKNVSAIHIGGKFSLLQRKFFNVLLSNSYDELLTKEQHQIRVREICDSAGCDTNNTEVAKEVLRSLKNTEVTWNLLGDDDKEEEWGVSSMIAEAVIKRGVCTYAFSPSMRKKLYQPEMYARINLSIMSNFNRSYSLALYENTTRFRGLGTTGWKDLAFWRYVLGVEEGEYQLFKEFNKKVIKPAVKEVNSISDILLEPEYRREKRRVAHIRFNIKQNPQIQIPFPIREKLMENARREAEEEKAKKGLAKVGTTSEAYQRMLSFGLSESQATGFQEEHDDDYIMQNLNIVESAYKAGKIAEALPKYTYSALKNDYRPKKSLFEKGMEQKKSEQKLKQERERLEKERRELLRNQFEAGRIEDVLKKMGSSERSAFEQRFHTQHEGNMVYQKTQKMGFGMDNPIVQGLFRAFVRNELLREPVEGEFEKYVRMRESKQQAG